MPFLLLSALTAVQKYVNDEKKTYERSNQDCDGSKVHTHHCLMASIQEQIKKVLRETQTLRVGCL